MMGAAARKGGGRAFNDKHFHAPRQRIGLVLAIYLITWSIPLLAGQPMISVFAVIPLILVPPVGLLIYCLVWKDFHE